MTNDQPKPAPDTDAEIPGATVNDQQEAMLVITRNRGVFRETVIPYSPAGDEPKS